jgi:DnaK suppressor protein
MNSKESIKFLRKLLAERDRIIASLKRNGEDEPRIDDTTTDSGDLAAVVLEMGLAYRLQDNDFSRLALVREALSRIEDGTYGICTECDRDIEVKRLEALPWAPTCLKCQEETEGSAFCGTNVGTGSVWKSEKKSA